MKNPQLVQTSKRGFTLIITISLLVLLTMVAVGVLSLSSVTLRASNQGNASAVARANARLALMLAIGDLQVTMGPDRAATGKAGSLFPDSPRQHLLGAWQGFGWQAPSGLAPAPSEKQQKFSRWLTSVSDQTARYDLNYGSTGSAADEVFLINSQTSGTLPNRNPEWKAERLPLRVGNQIGGLAYGVMDETMKLPINMEDQEAGNAMDNYAHRLVPPSTRPEVIDPDFTWQNPEGLISLPTASLALAKKSESFAARQQDLSIGSYGLLTDPVSGGLKIDLTPLMEGTAGANITSVTGSTTPYYSVTDGAPTWDYLRSYYQLYKRTITPGAPSVRLTTSNELRPSSVGLKPSPATASLLPVIAKLQIMFSMVSHHHHIGDRIQFHNEKAVPPGNTNHAVPHLVYEPIITLYNPYDVSLEFTSLRVRISDPPVGFQFQKHDIAKGTNPWYRQEFANGEYHSLARFQIANEKNNSARKFFTYHLKNKSTSGTPGGTLKLLPGEVRVFSAYVEKNWTWGMETSGGYTPRAFFDWNAGEDLGNIDRRSSNQFGLDAIPGVDFRAGLQTDHMSYGGGRPADSRYDFEVANNWGGGFLSMRLTDEVTVNARAQRCVTDSSLPDFRVDLLAGVNTSATSDILRTYDFRFANPATELGLTTTITRRFRNADILQSPADKTPGGKSPFAILTMSAKTTRDVRDDSKAWLQNNFATEGASQQTTKVGAAVQSYDVRLQEVTSYNQFPGVEIDPSTDRGFYGARPTSRDGVSVVPMYRVPVQPAASLGAWVAGNLVTSSLFPRVNYPLGNSFAHPMLPSGAITQSSPMGGSQKLLDHSYLMNASLWDRYFFSSATDNNSVMFADKRSRSVVLNDFFAQRKPMLNNRLVAVRGDESAENLASRVAAMDSKTQAQQFAQFAMIKNPFNVNSDSVDAWRGVLSSLRDHDVMGWNNSTFSSPEKTAFSRVGVPVAGSSDDPNPNNSVNAQGQLRWAGYRALTDKQIEELAQQIVLQIRERAKADKAPSLSLGDFVNRRIGSDNDLHALKGILQTAIDQTDINSRNHNLDSINLADPIGNRGTAVANRAALRGNSADGAPSILTQGDLMTALAPIITVRGDTFTVRAYGESRSVDGNTVLARTWCEATVQRTVDYVDRTNAPVDRDLSLTNIGKTGLKDLSLTNKVFGRRLVITSFRWLNAAEI